MSAVRVEPGSGFLHVRAGSDDWEPTQGDLETLQDMFATADLDPKGGVVVTRHDVRVTRISPRGVEPAWDYDTDSAPRDESVVWIAYENADGNECVALAQRFNDSAWNHMDTDRTVDGTPYAWRRAELPSTPPRAPQPDDDA